MDPATYFLFVGWVRCGAGPWTAVIACPLEYLCHAVIGNMFLDCADAAEVERLVLPADETP